MSRLDDRFIDELKQRVRLSDLVGKTVKLKRQGREYAGLSPFTKEKTPSFFVNDDKNFFHCFSSGKHGDAIGWLMETERLSFREAAERLAADVGMAIPEDDPRAVAQEKSRAGLREIIEMATSWYEGQLRQAGGANARSYLEKRGLSADLWGRFRVGFAPPSRTALRDMLQQRGIPMQDLVDSGLIIRLEGGETYDRFRNRIMFPITDARGRVISFSGRALDPEARAKYLNGPETPVFHKGATLYGLHEAKRLMGAAGQKADLVAAEGCMDAIAFQRADIGSVAPLGTALTEDQLEALWRQHPEPVLCFDGDAAGLRAAGAAIERALPMLKAGRALWFCMIQGAKDPDELLRERGPAALRKALERRHSLLAVLFELERRKHPLDTPERRQAFRERLIAITGAIKDRDLASDYRRELMRRWGEATRVKRDDRQQPMSPDARQMADRMLDALDPRAGALMVALVAHPDWADDELERLSSSSLGHIDLDGLAEDIVSFRFAGLQTPLRRWLEDRGHGRALMAAEAAAGQIAIRDKDTWIRLYNAVTEKVALSDAIDDIKHNIDAPGAYDQMLEMKKRRDALERETRSFR